MSHSVNCSSVGAPLAAVHGRCQRTVDLSDLISKDPRPIVAALRDEALFAELHVEHDMVVWQNGVDLAPEYLWERLRH